CDRIDCRQDFLEPKWIRETREIDLAQERRDGVLRFPEIRRHRSLAVADHAVALDLDEHAGRRRARTPRHREGMAQLEGVGAEAEFHCARNGAACLLSRTT